jgi:hypothetical protein
MISVRGNLQPVSEQHDDRASFACDAEIPERISPWRGFIAVNDV